MSDRQKRQDELLKQAEKRILLLDGAMGTMIQRHNLSEADFRGTRFADHHKDVRGNNELVALMDSPILADIHRAYFEAGADIAKTNTFSANAISQADYDMVHLVRELNVTAARIARAQADAAEAKTPDRPRFVAGVLGPTNRTASISPRVEDPGFRNVTFDELRIAYCEQAEALIDGGVDLLLVETIFDTLNAKAALYALAETFDTLGFTLPIMISGTITDLSGRLLSGQTAEAFWNSVRHAGPFSIGLNCALGAKELRPYVAELARVADTRVSAHPNAGLPNAFGGYDQTPAEMAALIGEFARAGLLNIAGGCCGTTPDHIRAVSEVIAGVPPRAIPEIEPKLRLSGLEPFTSAA